MKVLLLEVCLLVLRMVEKGIQLLTSGLNALMYSKSQGFHSALN